MSGYMDVCIERKRKGEKRSRDSVRSRDLDVKRRYTDKRRWKTEDGRKDCLIEEMLRKRVRLSVDTIYRFLKCDLAISSTTNLPNGITDDVTVSFKVPFRNTPIVLQNVS